MQFEGNIASIQIQSIISYNKFQILLAISYLFIYSLDSAYDFNEK